MVDEQAHVLDDVFHALADPTRRAMLSTLSKSPMSVSELAQPFDISLNAVSKHIKVLEAAGLLRREVAGRQHICHIDARPMHSGMEWMRHYEKFWNRKLDVLESLLVEEDKRLEAERMSAGDESRNRDKNVK